jgi:hypothetical protein
MLNVYGRLYSDLSESKVLLDTVDTYEDFQRVKNEYHLVFGNFSIDICYMPATPEDIARAKAKAWSKVFSALLNA